MISGRDAQLMPAGDSILGEATGPAPSGAGEVKRPLVLVVEDDPHDWEIYGKILWYNGYDVLYAAEGEQGYGLAREHRPDLVLLDLIIPKLDGISLCQRLKQDPVTADIPIVALSGRPYRDLGAAAMRAGCVFYLEKPVGPVEVLHKVEELIGRAPPAGEGRAPVKYPPSA